MLPLYRILLFACLLLVNCVRLSAQLDIIGTVSDSAGLGLPYANVVLLNADSSLAAFSTTDKKGAFKLSVTPGAKEYLLRASYVGYASLARTIEVGPNDQLLNLGRISLSVQGYLLDGAEVNGYRIPIRMRGDTVVFDADAFATGPNAVVEDLLRQLPGLSIQSGGAILFHGKPVSEVMVNGRPFFRGNTQLLTQNLNASAVENVEVFDRKSASETVSGEDDGREDLTVNLTIKQEAEGDPFGEVYVGAGTDRRYRAGGKAFRINGQKQLGAVATANNLNQIGLSYQDLSSIGQAGNLRGGGSGISPLRNSGQVLGDNRTLACGLNQSSPFGKTANTTLSYLLYDVSEGIRAIETNRYANQTLGEQVIIQERDTRTYLHHIAADYEYQRDTSAWLTLRIDGQLGGRRLNNASLVQWQQQSDTSAYAQSDVGRDRLPRLSARFDYSQRLNASGSRTLALTNEASFNEEREQLATMVTGLGMPSEFLSDGARQWSSDFSTWRNDGQLSFRQNVSKNWTTTAALEYTAQRTRSVAELQRIERSASDFESTYTLFSPIVRVRRRLGEGHISLGIGRQMLDWQLSGDLSRRVQKGYWAPHVSYASGPTTGRLSFTLQGNPEVPQVGDLFALPNPREVRAVRLGSPSLSPAYRYQASGNYTLFNQFAGFSLFANARAAHINSAIGNALDLRGVVPVSQAVNLAYAREVSSYVRLGQVFGPLRLKASAESSLTRRAGPGILNGAPTSNEAITWMAGLRVQRSLGEDGYVALGYRLTQVRSRFDESTRVGASTRGLSLTGEQELVKRLRAATTFTQQHFSSLESNSSPARLPLWELSLEWQAWKDKPHSLKLTVADLFNQNRGVQQEALGFLVRETQSNSLGRYAVLSAHWRL
ncbi:MAG: carboxypeptidase regulatory-like domain-containing protein [Saprospiraceae bacterium]